MLAHLARGAGRRAASAAASVAEVRGLWWGCAAWGSLRYPADGRGRVDRRALVICNAHSQRRPTRSRSHAHAAQSVLGTTRSGMSAPCTTSGCRRSPAAATGAVQGFATNSHDVFNTVRAERGGGGGWEETASVLRARWGVAVAHGQAVHPGMKGRQGVRAQKNRKRRRPAAASVGRAPLMHTHTQNNDNDSTKTRRPTTRRRPSTSRPPTMSASPPSWRTTRPTGRRPP
jgi:hypothetical protein